MSPSILISPEVRKKHRDYEYYHEMVRLYGLYRPKMPKDFMPEVTALTKKMAAEYHATRQASMSDSSSAGDKPSTTSASAAHDGHPTPDKDRYLLFPNGTFWATEGDEGEDELRNMSVDTLLEEVRSRPSVPIEEKWFRSADWLDTRRKLVAMIKSGDIQPLIPKEREQDDGTLRDVKTPIWQLWPKPKDLMAQLSLDGGEEELREIQFMAKLKGRIEPVLGKQFEKKVMEIHARHDPARVARILREHGQDVPKWVEDLLAEREDEDRPPTPEPAPEPVQRRQQAPLNRNERRAAQRRQQRKS